MADDDSPAQVRRPKVVLVAAIAVFALATGAFSTLWFIERGDHGTTTDQITAVDAELKEAETDLRAAQQRIEENGRQLPQLREKTAKARAEADANNDCARAGQAMVKALDQAAMQAATQQLVEHCGSER